MCQGCVDHPNNVQRRCILGHQARQAAPGFQQRCNQRAGDERCGLAGAQQLPGCVVLPGLAHIKAGNEADQEPFRESRYWQLLPAGLGTPSLGLLIRC